MADTKLKTNVTELNNLQDKVQNIQIIRYFEWKPHTFKLELDYVK